MNDEPEAGRAATALPPGAAPPPAGATPGVPGWFPDPWSKTLRRWWTGQSWTFATTDLVDGPTPPPPPSAVAPPPPPAAPPPPPPPPPPAAPVTTPPPAPVTEPWTKKVGRFVGGHRILVAVVAGLVIGLLGVRLFHSPSRPSTSSGGSALAPRDTTPGGTTPTSPAPSTDPSSSALASLIVKPADVSSSLTVTLLPGGGGLSQATLDICNGNFPSESQRTARLQDLVLDEQGQQSISTEAVLYKDGSGATQAFTELKSVAAACPSTPVSSPVGEPTVITKFNPAPDGSWPQTPTVNRLAFDFTSTDSSGQSFHSVAVYLQRGRALMGVYFSQPDSPQITVAGQNTIPGIVGVFAGRMAALPTSVVGS